MVVDVTILKRIKILQFIEKNIFHDYKYEEAYNYKY